MDIKANFNDKEIRGFIEEQIEGQVKSISREMFSIMIEDALTKKVETIFENYSTTALFENALKRVLSNKVNMVLISSQIEQSIKYESERVARDIILKQINFDSFTRLIETSTFKYLKQRIDEAMDVTK